MKILLTGATGYIGKRLLPILIEMGHHVVCAVRDKSRFSFNSEFEGNISVIELDLLDSGSLKSIPADIDGAYYLVHSMSHSDDFEELERQSAENFKNAVSKTNAKHLIYLGGIANDKSLSKHLTSRMQVEKVLSSGDNNFTSLRAGIIIGSGSASFEIIRDLVEKLPAMLTPKWVLTKSQPIAIRDVLQFLSLSLFNEYTYNKTFDIGGPDILTYKDMLLKFGKVRDLKRYIFTVPVMTPRLSSYWLYFVTRTSYKLAVNLVNSMKNEIVGKPNDLAGKLGIELLIYEDALNLAFMKIEQDEVTSSWKDALSSSHFENDLHKSIKVPEYGTFKDKKKVKVKDEANTLEKVWSIGGETGWYYADWLWGIRGFLDKLFGGVGLRRGRTHIKEINSGDTLDFWRVLLADKENMRLLLYAEMKLPGEAWLEFKIKDGYLHQTATFKPKGLLGRLYWYSVLPFHGFIFKNMSKQIAE